MALIYIILHLEGAWESFNYVEKSTQISEEANDGLANLKDHTFL